MTTLTTCLLRLGVAAVLGMLIGIERDLQGRAAGIRTHLLVCTGAALFTLISVMIGYTVTAGRHIGDPARIAAQVVTGIGFLGAGTILKSGLTVRGLTTAAYLWLTAAIGVAGIRQVSLAVIVAIVTDFWSSPSNGWNGSCPKHILKSSLQRNATICYGTSKTRSMP